MYKIQSSRRMQIRRQVCIHKQLNLLMKRKMQQLLQFTLRRMMNNITAHDEQHTEVERKYSRMTRLNSESDSIISRTVVFKKGKNWDLHLESSRQDPKIRENPTLQHSVNDPSNGPCAWEKWQENQLGHCTRTANGTTHATEEATLNFCDLNMFVEVQ